MASFEREFNSALEAAERNALLDMIRSRPEMSLADLAKLARGRVGSLLSTLTVGELLNGAARGGRKGRAPAVRLPGGAVNTRTPAGRKAYDQAVLGVVQASSKPISASKVRSEVGGTPLQARKALNRLIEAGHIGFEGKARATKYFPA